MQEGYVVFGVLTVIAIFFTFAGWFICMLNGYYDYYTDKIKQKECEHKHFHKYDNYSHTVYDNNLNEKKVCFKFECLDCGLIKYKEIDLGDDK